MPDQWWKKLQSETYHQERQKKLYEEFQCDLKEIELTEYSGEIYLNDYATCVDNLWERAYDWKEGDPNPTLNEEEKSKLRKLLEPQRIKIEKYTKEKYGENWKAEYERLCKVAEARLEEDIIQDVIDKRTLNLKPGNAPMLTPDSKEILEAWDKKWADRDGLSEFDAQKLQPKTRYAFHAMFAYLETTVGAFQIFRDYGLKTEFLPMPPESDKVQVDDATKMQSRLILYWHRDTGRIVEYTNDIVFEPNKIGGADVAKSAALRGFQSFTGKGIDPALHHPAHEYYHKTAAAIAWKLYNKITLTGNGQITFARCLDFVNRKLARTICKIAKNKLGYELKAGIRMTEKGRDTQGVSMYGTDSPAELVAEQGSSRSLTLPEERNAPTQAMDELFKYGADAVADALYAYLNTKKGQEEFDGHKKYLEDGYGYDMKKIPAEIAKEYERIQNSNIKKAAEDDYLYLARFSTTYATYHAELTRWKVALANLKKLQDDGTLDKQLSTQKTALEENNKFVKYRQQYDWDATDVKNKIERFAAANLLNGLKPPRPMEDKRQQSDLDNIKIPSDPYGTLVYLEQTFGAHQVIKNYRTLDEKQKISKDKRSLQALADGADRDAAIARYSRLLTKAITWNLYLERNPALIKQNSLPMAPKAEFEPLRGFVEQKLAEAIKQIASEKGSKIVESNSSKLITEAAKSMALVKPGNRDALGQAMYELFQNGLRPVVNELHEYMKSEQGKKEYDNYKMPIPKTLSDIAKGPTDTDITKGLTDTAHNTSTPLFQSQRKK